jgi:NADPH:quinone reductase-like Zn-dependent oxidoreductase
VSLDFFQLLGGPERVTIQHFHYAGAPYGSDLSALVSLVEQGRLHPEISRTTDWAQTADTLVDLRERRIRGKAVLLTGGAR